MITRRRRVTLGLAVATGVLGGGLAGVGGVGLAAAAGSEVCPDGSVMYRPIDSDAFICVADGRVVTPVDEPIASEPVLNWEVDPAPPASYRDDPALQPTNAPTATPVSTPAPVVNAPGQIPLPTNAPLPTQPTKPAIGQVVQGAAITREQVIARAVTWVVQAVPYSQTSWWTDKNGTYRQDCSGYVSMAWALDQRTNYWTGNLATVSKRIASAALQPGDVLLLPRHHVVLFAGWANSARTKFNLYEEYSRGKPARYLVNASLSYYLDRGYGAYRYDKIVDPVARTADRTAADLELTSSSVPLGVTPVTWTEELAAQAESETMTPRAAGSSGTAMALLAVGLGLLFLTFPLTIVARTTRFTEPT